MAEPPNVEGFDENEWNGEENVSEPKRKRQLNRVWMKRQEFQSAEEAQLVISKDKWQISSKKKTLDGCKVEYRCTAGKYRVKECPAGLYLLYHSATDKVSLFATECGHKHDDNTEFISRGLSNEAKNFIKEKYDEGIQKPNAILAIMRQKNVMEPPKSKLVTYLKQLRVEKYGNPTISGSEITTWCKARTKIPDSKDELFVLNYKVSCESFLDPDEQDIKIVLSTPRLLENLKKSKMIQINATYKIIWQGYPVIIVGTSDKNQAFHPFAIAVCKGESAADFSFIFEALRNFDLAWKPLLLLADTSESITQGFTNIFGMPEVRIMCFVHVIKNVEKYFKKFSAVKDLLKQDIYALHTCKDESTYFKASQLFLEKWSTTDDDQVTDFINYFKLQWMLKNSNWYEGVAVGYPSTNNGLESINAVIKKEHTLRERLPAGQFLNNVQILLVKWSKDRDPESPNFQKFSEVASISLQQWTLACQWAMMNKKVLQEIISKDCELFYVCSKSANQPISTQLLSTYKEKEGKWETFDDFKEYHYGVWMITIVYKDLDASKCTCPYFLRHRQCKHVLGMKIRLKLVDVPTEAKLIPLGQKRKRGRPARAEKALIVQ